MLDEKADEDDVWGYVDEIRERNVPMEFRQQFYQRWIAMVATRAMSERDALISHAQPVFKFRTETARHDVEQLVQSGVSTTMTAPSVICPEFIAEMIHCPGQSPSVRYLVYKIADGSTEIQDHVTIGEVSYTPPLVASLVDARALLLATATEEYGDVQDLQASMRAFITRYVQLDNETDVDLAAFYAHYTWIADRIPVAPYLHAVGDFEAGKSRLLDVIGHLVRGGLFMAGSLTSAVVYRALDLAKATLIIDEADFNPKSPAWEEILKVLLTGSQASRPILRTDMDAKGAIRAFDPFGPKVLASRKPFYDDALTSRCLDFTMYPGNVSINIPLILPSKEWNFNGHQDEPLQSFYAHAQSLRNKLLLWRFRNARQVDYNPVSRYDGLSPRITQAAIALLATSGQSPHVQELILSRLRDKSVAVKERRKESEAGQVTWALIQRWRKMGKPRQVELKQVTEQLRVDTEDKDIREKHVASIIRGPLGLKTKRSTGGRIVIETAASLQLQTLSNRYGVPAEANAKLSTRAPVGKDEPAPPLPDGQPIVVSEAVQSGKRKVSVSKK